jgi:peptide subunit release factor 1 (eRF1)
MALFTLTCPVCGKVSETASAQRKSPHVKCSDCLVEMKLNKVKMVYTAEQGHKIEEHEAAQTALRRSGYREYRFHLTCPACGRCATTVTGGWVPSPPRVNCPDCFMDRTEKVEMKVVKVEEKRWPAKPSLNIGRPA